MEHKISFDEKILNGKDNPDREKTCKELKLYAESSFNKLEEELQKYSPLKIGQDQEFDLYHYGFRRLLNLEKISVEFEDTPLETLGLGKVLLHYDQPRLRDVISRKYPFDKYLRQRHHDVTLTVPFKESREDSVLLRHARSGEKEYLGEGSRLLHVSAPFGFCSDSYPINNLVPPILASALFEAVAYAVINYDLFFGDIYLGNLRGYNLRVDNNSTYQNALITVSNEKKFSPEKLVETIRSIGIAVLDLSKSEDYILAIRELDQVIEPRHKALESEIGRLNGKLYGVKAKRHKIVEEMHQTVINRLSKK